jgi:HSP20 family protein
MPNVEIQKVKDGQKESLPFSREFDKRFNQIQHRAFELFESSGRRFGRDLENWLTAEREIFGSPPAELADNGYSYELQMALPGFEPKDVEVTATPGELIIHAASSQEKKSEKKNVLWSEFVSSDVYRRIPAPTPLSTEGAAATLEKGVLRITAPKAVETKPKTVSTRAA